MTRPAAGLAVRVRGLTKAYGDTPVLRGVDLDVPADGVSAVLGPSGCGKTTLLRLVAGFDRPDGGTVALHERVVAGEAWVPPQERRVGYVPQEGALFPHLTVAANVTFGLPAARRRTRDRVAELLELVGLPAALADRHPHQLSGGQQQRVALARALAPSPALVLLDEPFASLDAGLREETRAATGRALADAGAAAVLVTHDQDEALSFASYVSVMREGVVVQSASPRELYDGPVDTGVARFVGAAVLLTGTVRGGRVTCALGDLGTDAASASAEGPVTVLVRPEQLLLGDSGVPARVEDVTYYGHDGTARLRLADGTDVVARTTGARLPEVGSEVRLRVEGPVRAFPG